MCCQTPSAYIDGQEQRAKPPVPGVEVFQPVGPETGGGFQEDSRRCGRRNRGSGGADLETPFIGQADFGEWVPGAGASCAMCQVSGPTCAPSSAWTPSTPPPALSRSTRWLPSLLLSPTTPVWSVAPRLWSRPHSCSLPQGPWWVLPHALMPLCFFMIPM